MARANMLLLIAGCVMMAAVCIQAEDFSFTFTEQMNPDNEIKSFGLVDSSNADGEKGNGYIYTNIATKTNDVDSEVYGTVHGFTVYPTASISEEVFAIVFEDIDEKGGRFANAELHCRGIWAYDKDGKEADVQEIAIVGGSYGLAKAYGTLNYTRQGKSSAWVVHGTFQIDDCHL